MLFDDRERLQQEHVDKWVHLRAASKVRQDEERLVEDADLRLVLLDVACEHRINHVDQLEAEVYLHRRVDAQGLKH